MDKILLKFRFLSTLLVVQIVVVQIVQCLFHSAELQI